MYLYSLLLLCTTMNEIPLILVTSSLRHFVTHFIFSSIRLYVSMSTYPSIDMSQRGITRWFDLAAAGRMTGTTVDLWVGMDFHRRA